MCTFNTPFYRLRKPEKWLGYFKCMKDSKTIRSSAHEISVNKNTSFLWRHKFLKLLNIQKDTHLSGIIEIDETFFKFSEKGSRHLTHQETEVKVRGRKKHGSIPVIVARDRQQNTFNLVMESIKVDDIYKVVKDHIDPDSIICSDSYPVYPSLCKKLNLVHKKINIKQHIRIVENVFHIQNVNSYHSQLKYWMTRFHGVATKNLNNYLSWFRFLESKNDPNENSLLLAQTQLIQT
jgi:transposase-like protein